MPNKLPVEQIANIVVAKYDPGVCLLIVAEVAKGEKSLKAILEEKQISRTTFYRWKSLYPDLNRAYAAAKELSAESFEDRALDIARYLEKKENAPFLTAQRISALRAAMEQYRWSASHRDPTSYGVHTQINIAVPVTITTPLDLGNGNTPTMPQTETAENIYNVTAMVDVPVGEADNSPAEEVPSDELDTTAVQTPLVEKQKRGRKPQTGPDPSVGKANTRASRYRARKNIHPRAREILEGKVK